MSSTNIEPRRDFQDDASTRKGRQDGPRSQRIEVFNDGTHRHFLGHQQTGIFRRLSDAFKRYNAKLELNNRQSVATGSVDEPSTTRSFGEKYGKCEKIIHYGGSSSVRLHHGSTKDIRDKELYAVKVFHHYSKRTIDDPLRSELSIAFRLKHANVIRTIEILDNDRGELCLVMDYCGAGDLQSLIVASGKLKAVEADCFFKQLMRAISYLHDSGIAHQNLNPDDILLTVYGSVKVGDFGEASWVQGSLQRQKSLSREPYGSILYQPPEAILGTSSDPRPGDVWAAALIYMAMKTGRRLWNIASKEDKEFEKYLSTRSDESGYLPIHRLHNVSFFSMPSS
jgi:serine/threonine protein kinase